MTEKTEETPVPAARPEPADQLVTTEHTITIGGRTIAYTVTCGTMVLQEEAEKEGKSEGETRRAARERLLHRLHARTPARPAQRPDHVLVQRRPRLVVGVAAPRRARPRRVVMDEAGNLPRRPTRSPTTSTRCSTLTDLVFIDPVSTGYSRTVAGEKAKEYHDVQDGPRVGRRLHPPLHARATAAGSRPSS